MFTRPGNFGDDLTRRMMLLYRVLSGCSWDAQIATAMAAIRGIRLATKICSKFQVHGSKVVVWPTTMNNIFFLMIYIYIIYI